MPKLNYTPVPLKFGTSGRRGEVIHLSQLEIYINATAELEYLQSLPVEQGGIRKGDEFFFAADLRPSSTTFVPTQGGRGELAQAIHQAIADAGMSPVYLGQIPTPALTAYAIARERGSIMVTGSHIPFDRNGYKTNTCRGELLKVHEEPINAKVAAVRAAIDPAQLFDENGRLRAGHRELPPALADAAQAYQRRYVDFFGAAALKGFKLLVYQHSAVGRDLLAETLRALGAEVTTGGRSDTFVPIDTENIQAEQLAPIQALLGGARFDAVVSTDGDSDRPLLLGIDENGQAVFLGGDLVGMIVAQFLGADAVVVPITCNDGIDRGALATVLQPKTRIGSPYVIAGMEQALAQGFRKICGWEANGGFLTGSDFHRNGATLSALPTRDAFLPLIAALCSARAAGQDVLEHFAQLPKRYSKAALLPNFPRPAAMKILAAFPAGDPSNTERLAKYFPGFGPIQRLDFTDGLRILFASGDVAHLRPSGNADELRIYAVADSPERAAAIAAAGTAEPGGILRQLERDLAGIA